MNEEVRLDRLTVEYVNSHYANNDSVKNFIIDGTVDDEIETIIKKITEVKQ